MQLGKWRLNVQRNDLPLNQAAGQWHKFLLPDLADDKGFSLLMQKMEGVHVHACVHKCMHKWE